jgi:glycosyltransferase involved in cell wall biosynthesis
MRIFLLEPDSGGRISGGYLYNSKMAEGSSAIVRCALRVDRLEDDLRALEPPTDTWLLADSLFLNPEHVSILRRRFAGTRQRLGVLLHAFPSFIRRAEDRDTLARALPLLPSLDELALLEQLDLLVAPGPYVPRLLVECGCSVPALVCPPGVDANIRPLVAAGSHGGPVQILSIGSVTPLKGFIDAAEALARLGPANFRWTIVGHLGVSPEHAERLRQRILELGLAERVELAGQRDHAETLQALRQSDLLLCTSFTENHPLVALEALAARIPVVGYAVGGLPDIIRHGRTGLLSPLLDVGALSAHLGRLIADPGERQRLADGCGLAAAELPTWAEAAGGFVQALASMGDAPRAGERRIH